MIVLEDAYFKISYWNEDYFPFCYWPTGPYARFSVIEGYSGAKETRKGARKHKEEFVIETIEQEIVARPSESTVDRAIRERIRKRNRKIKINESVISFLMMQGEL